MPSIIIPFTFRCYKCFHEPRKDRKFISQCATFSKSHFKRAHATGLQRSPKEYLYANLFNTPYHMLSQSVISWLLYIEMPILMSAGAVLYEYLARTELLSTFFYNCSFTRKKFLKDKGLQFFSFLMSSSTAYLVKCLFSIHAWSRRTFPEDFQAFLPLASSFLILHTSRSLVINSIYVLQGRPLVFYH